LGHFLFRAHAPAPRPDFEKFSLHGVGQRGTAFVARQAPPRLTRAVVAGLAVKGVGWLIRRGMAKTIGTG
jgi:hypothetical protein